MCDVRVVRVEVKWAEVRSLNSKRDELSRILGKGLKLGEKAGKTDFKEVFREVDDEELKEIVSKYLDRELEGKFQLEPEKAFEFGRKMRNEHSLTLSEVERLVNLAVPAVFEEKAGDIRTMLCHQFYENYLGYFVSGLYHDIIGNRKLVVEIRMPKLIARSRVGFRWGMGYRHPSGVLVVRGYAGGYLGEKMRGGRVVVTGYTGDCVGKDMRGGEILIKGNTGWRLGEGMRGGKIVVFGDVGEYTGINMSSGLIRIKGSVISFGRRSGGRIELWMDGEWRAVD